MIPKQLPGEQVDKSSRTLGETSEAVEQFQAEQFTMEWGDRSSPTTNKGNLVYAMNMTGAGIPWYGVIQLTNVNDNTLPPRAYQGTLDEINFKRRVYLSAVLPQGEIEGPERNELIGIAQLPVPNIGDSYHNAVGRFLVQGVTQCKVHYASEEELRMEYAMAAVDDEDVGIVEYLVPATRGPARILWNAEVDTEAAAFDSDGQTVWCLVELTHTPRPHGITICQVAGITTGDPPVHDGPNAFTAPGPIIMDFGVTQAKCGHSIIRKEIPAGDLGAEKFTIYNDSGRAITGWLGWNVSVKRKGDGTNTDPETEVKVEILVATEGAAVPDDTPIWGSVWAISTSRRGNQTPTMNGASGFMLITIEKEQFIKIRLTGESMAPPQAADDDLDPVDSGCHLSFFDPGCGFDPYEDTGDGSPL